MTLAQALARIEELHQILAEKDDGSKRYAEVWLEHQDLIVKHADHIVQMWKVAAQMRYDFDACTIEDGPNDGVRAYDKLMNGEEDVD